MNYKKLIAVCFWTLAYLVLAAALFTFAAMGDCLQGTEGAACRAQSNAFINMLLVIELLAYPILTWLLFFRRR